MQRKMLNTTEKIMTWQAADQAVSSWKSEGNIVVFTNGCFDLLHLGHVDYLEKAKALGDKLVVGLNTDDSVRRFKGETRPIQDQVSRARVMAALEFVDAVVLFDEDTPLQLITRLMPNVLAKGADYTVETIVGADIVMKAGGQVKTVELVPGYSTTRIVKRIQETG